MGSNRVNVRLKPSAPRSVSLLGVQYQRGKLFNVDQTVLNSLMAYIDHRGESVFEVVADDQPVSVHRFRDASGREQVEKLLATRKAGPVAVLIPEDEIPQFSVVIPMYGKPELTQACVSSVLETSSPTEIIVVDDGSAEPYEDDRVSVVRLDENSGFSAAVNCGVAVVSTPFVVLLNNDTTLCRDGVRALLSALRDPSVGIAGPFGKELPPEVRDAGTPEGDVGYIEMSCCAFRLSTWLRVGGLDNETFGRGYFEDVDWCRRAQVAGFRLAPVAGEVCIHAGGATFGRSPETMAQVYASRDAYIHKHRRGRAVVVLGALGCNGGGKVAKYMAEALQDDKWDVTLCSFTPWETAAMDFGKFGKVTPQTIGDGEWDIAVSTFHSTMPFVAKLPAKNRFALIQSDEPEWGPDAHARANFSLPGFKHIIIANHMRCFGKKYGMNIVGQIDNGVDSTSFYPTWLFQREWPHHIMVIRKGASVWFAGQEYAEEAIAELSRRYSDFGVVVLGGNKPDWPCRVQHVKTFNEYEINKLYNSVSAVVVPSLIEGRSLVPLEAAAAGCPVVSTRVGMDYVRDGEDALLVPYKDPAAIVEAVVRIFEDQALAERLAKNGLKIAQKYTWRREQDQFKTIINREVEAL